MRLAAVQNPEALRKNLDAGLEAVNFSSDVKERSFDVALIQHVIPGWLERLGYLGAGDQAVQVLNERVGPYVDLSIKPDGAVEKTGVTKGTNSDSQTLTNVVQGSVGRDATRESNSRRKGLSPKSLRKIPRAPFMSRSIPKPLSSRITVPPPRFSSTLPSQLRVLLV